MKKILYLSLTILLVTLLSQSAYAQDKDKDPGKLHFSIAPYFWVLNIDGTNTVGSVEVPLDVDIVVGYKLLDILYSNEKEGRDLFKFDGYLSGILVGLNFRL